MELLIIFTCECLQNLHENLSAYNNYFWLIFQMSCLLMHLYFPTLQSCADQQWVGHWLLPEVWLWDYWDKEELLQEDRACRCPCVAKEPAQSLCTAQWRASEVRVGAQRSEKALMWPPPQKQNCDKCPRIQHFLQRTLKRENKFQA